MAAQRADMRCRPRAMRACALRLWWYGRHRRNVRQPLRARAAQIRRVPESIPSNRARSALKLLREPTVQSDFLRDVIAVRACGTTARRGLSDMRSFGQG